ncbi:MAG: site-specific integrase [Thermodesulfovibrionales bacterium]|nr:site-specific integrase [Thermodesulfovibrionales bacterium]
MAKEVRPMPFKRGNKYYVSFVVDGVRYQKAIGEVDIKQAKQIEKKIKAQIALGKFEPEVLEKKERPMTVQELSVKYLEYCQGRNRALYKKASFIRQINTHFGNYFLHEVTTLELERYQSQSLKKNKPATINRHLATIKHMFNKAYHWGLITEEVNNQVKRCKLLKEDNKRMRYLSHEECIRLVDACDEHIRPIVIMALNTGMRKGEILNLKWENVDLKHGFILLEKTKNGDKREIPINDNLREILNNLIRRIDSPYVFYNQKTGKPYHPEIKRSFHSALKRAGIKDFRFHDLRHTFASHLVMAGVDITTVSKLLGHKSITMTLRYSHLSPSHTKKAVSVLNEIFSKKQNLSVNLA